MKVFMRISLVPSFQGLKIWDRRSPTRHQFCDLFESSQCAPQNSIWIIIWCRLLKLLLNNETLQFNLLQTISIRVKDVKLLMFHWVDSQLHLHKLKLGFLVPNTKWSDENFRCDMEIVINLLSFGLTQATWDVSTTASFHGHMSAINFPFLSFSHRSKRFRVKFEFFVFTIVRNSQRQLRASRSTSGNSQNILDSFKKNFIDNLSKQSQIKVENNKNARKKMFWRPFACGLRSLSMTKNEFIMTRIRQQLRWLQTTMFRCCRWAIWKFSVKTFWLKLEQLWNNFKSELERFNLSEKSQFLASSDRERTQTSNWSGKLASFS